MASLTQWTWVWACSRRWWRTGKPGVLWSVGSQRNGYGWVTEKQQQSYEKEKRVSYYCIPHTFYTWLIKLYNKSNWDFKKLSFKKFLLYFTLQKMHGPDSKCICTYWKAVIADSMWMLMASRKLIYDCHTLSLWHDNYSGFGLHL